MSRFLYARVVALIVIVNSVSSTPDDPLLAYDFLYNEGVGSYTKEDWETCIKNFEMALEDWHWWQDNVIRCRRECSQENSGSNIFSANLTVDDKFFERMVRNTLCLVKCKKRAFGSRMDRVAEAYIDEDFEIRKPYDYLQLCYYKMGELKKAADASATVLAVQPNHEVMSNNLKYYVSEGHVDIDMVVNMELQEYGKEYILGNDAYNNKDYKATVEHMEKSLELYPKVLDDCRLLCEKPFDQGWFPDFVSSIANHYTYTLRCKRRCGYNLSNLWGEDIDDFYASYFNYLQFSYFQEGNLQKACEAVASALVLNPDNPSMLRNKQFYITEQGVREAYFTPREEVVAYKEREDFETQMMGFIETNFIFLNDDQFLEDIDEDSVEQDEPLLERESGGSSSTILGDKKDNETKVILESRQTVNDDL